MSQEQTYLYLVKKLLQWRALSTFMFVDIKLFFWASKALLKVIYPFANSVHMLTFLSEHRSLTLADCHSLEE